MSNPALPLPNSWSTTNECYDGNVVHGLTFRKHIEATQWSRKKGVAGKDPLNIPVQEFLLHGVSDWRLRALSHGKFFSIVPVASVAEAVFMAQVLKVVRERKVDIDAVATHVFQKDNPAAPIPNKNTDAPALFQPLINMIVQMLQDNTPVAAGIDQSQRFLQMSEELSRRREQLEAAGVPVTPQKASNSRTTLPVSSSLPSDPRQAGVSSSTWESDLKGKIDSIPDDALSDHKGRLKGSGEDDVSKWIQSFKRPLGKKFPEFQDHVTRVTKLVQSNFGGKENGVPTEWGGCLSAP